MGAIATGQWPGPCDNWEGMQYAIIFGAFFGSFAIAVVIDALLFYHGLKGAPFQESQRQWVVPLLYAGTVPLVLHFFATLWGTWVSVSLDPNCWEPAKKNAVTNFAQALVFINWAFCFLAL